ncbi:loricrin-like [Dreissena polymorpha]|uniref:Uncharacterized protein n=1 Tax=Dreissena polymorpha TaxID=45954 RepID=A0A9D4QVB4_DREPO|nr:loricrin-like [Dreissena polymorpha]KAH3844303.1 hypothetical protein DPMN_086560 [Dreissena polymorpha]
MGNECGGNSVGKHGGGPFVNHTFTTRNKKHGGIAYSRRTGNKASSLGGSNFGYSEYSGRGESSAWEGGHDGGNYGCDSGGYSGGDCSGGDGGGCDGGCDGGGGWD